MVVDGFAHVQWPDRLVKQKKIKDGSDRERRHLAGGLRFFV
jgi:hypothetical protein